MQKRVGQRQRMFTRAFCGCVRVRHNPFAGQLFCFYSAKNILVLIGLSTLHQTCDCGAKKIRFEEKKAASMKMFEPLKNNKSLNHHVEHSVRYV